MKSLSRNIKFGGYVKNNSAHKYCARIDHRTRINPMDVHFVPASTTYVYISEIPWDFKRRNYNSIFARKTKH